MKTENIIVALIAGICYNLSVIDRNPLPFGLLAALIIGGIITGIIMIFKKDRSNWSSVFMWVTIVISIISGIGSNLQPQNINTFTIKNKMKKLLLILTKNTTMKRLLLILLCLPMIGFGQQTYVPDDNFEAYLEANGMGKINNKLRL